MSYEVENFIKATLDHTDDKKKKKSKEDMGKRRAIVHGLSFLHFSFSLFFLPIK